MFRVDKLYSNEKYTYIIAEVSQSHEGSLGQAHAFIDAVASTGADAIKFQTHIASEESTVNEPFRVKFSYEDKTRYDYWKRMEFTKEQWYSLRDHARNVGLDFISSPFSYKALKLLDDLDVPLIKLGSGEVFNEMMLNNVNDLGRKVVISTGMSSYDDIEYQISKLKNCEDIILLQCTTAYPCPSEDVGLNVIAELKRRYPYKVGFSDHSADVSNSIAAATLGAEMIEVHVTLSKHMFGPDVSSSLDIDELSGMVNAIRNIDKVLNNPVNKDEMAENKHKLKKIFSKSIYASKEISKGEVITASHIALKKPNDGIDSLHYKKVLGRVASTNISAETLLDWDHFDEE